MAFPKVLPISQVLISQKQVSLIVSYKSFDQKEPSIAQLKLDNDQKIQDFIKNNLGQFDIKDRNPSLYGLRLSTTHQYINEKNRADLLALRDGKRFHEVELCFNLETEVRNFIEKISSHKLASQIDAVNTLLLNIQPYIYADQLFASELFAKRGKRLVIDYIKDCDKLTDPRKWHLILNLYKIIICFIQKWKLTSWDRSEIDLPVIQLIADTVNESAKENNKKSLVIPDELVLLFLQIIDDILTNSQHTRELMLRDLKLADIVFLVQRQSSAIKEALLVLFNNIFSQGEPEILRSLHMIFSQPQHVTLLREACRDDRNNTEAILENFQILQKNILDIGLGQKLSTTADATCLTKLKFIADKAFEASTGDKVLSDEEKFKRLGFVTPANPMNDFQTCPPGLLPLDFMYYFAEKPAMRQILYDIFAAKFVSEKLTKNSDYSFPFAKASIAMVKLICRILSIGDKHTKVEDNFKILFLIFTLNNDGINEFFAKCLCLFKRLWFEMKAQSLDFERALLALRESLEKVASEAQKLRHAEIQRAGSGKSSSHVYKKCITNFNVNIEMWKYDNLKVPRSNDKSSREPIKQAEKILTEEVLQMLKPKRMNVLIKGEKFDKIQAKDKKPTKQKQVWKLSSDHKVFTFIEYDNSGEEVNSSQLEVERIHSVFKEDLKNRQYFALNLSTDMVTYLLGSTHEEIVDFWFDAIKMLINSEPGTNITCFVNCLIDTQLLDLQTLGFDSDIPHEMPAVPDLPTDFNFQFIRT